MRRVRRASESYDGVFVEPRLPVFAPSAGAAQRMIDGMRACAKGGGTVAPIVRDYALPIAQAQVAHAAGRTSRRWH